MVSENRLKRKDRQYIDVLLCFCNYFLISQKQSHDKKDIYKFLSQNKPRDLQAIARSLKQTSIAYEVWQIFDFLDLIDLERIRKKTLKQLGAVQ